jgi:hypothetical protein
MFTAMKHQYRTYSFQIVPNADGAGTPNVDDAGKGIGTSRYTSAGGAE